MDTSNTLPRPQRHYLLPALLLLLLLPLSSHAADGDFDTPSLAFTWYPKGQGCIHLKLMTTNANPFRTLHTATYGLRDKDGNEMPVFYIGETNSDNDGYVKSLFTNKMDNTSLLYLTNDTYWKPLCLITGGAEQEHTHVRSGKDNGYAELDWYYPASLAGKMMTFYVDATLWRQGGQTASYKRDLGTMEFDDINFESYDALPSTEVGEEGMLSIPFSCDHVIKWVDASYTDGNGKRVDLPRLTLPDNSYNGFLPIPSTVPHYDLTLNATVVTGKPAESDVPKSDWPKENTGVMTKVVRKGPMLHYPRLFKAELVSDSACNASVHLKWVITDKGYDDALDSDVFQVQRSLTGRLEDFEDLDGVMFDSNDSVYEYIDDKLISALTPQLIDRQVGIPIVRYRVVRGSTAQLWGMDKNPTVAYAMPRIYPLQLPRPKNVKAVWADEDNREVSLKWDYELSNKAYEESWDDSFGSFVWDSRAEMTARVMMYNREGLLIDSLVHVLTDAERTQRQVALTLNRSCVSYDISLSVDAKDSPIGHATGDLLVNIKSQNDWDQFADRVNNGETKLNAIFSNYYPIIGKISQTLGTLENPFRGIILGYGHLLRMDLITSESYAAPIRCMADGAVVSDLTINGRITTQNKFCAGVVGQVTDGSVFVENCQVQVIIDSSINGDGSHGGIASLLDGDNSIFITNCIFGGSIYGSRTSDCGGLVGFVRKTSFALLDRCYFAPMQFYLSEPGCATLARSNASGLNLALRDAYYKKPMGLVQGVQANAVPKEWEWTYDDSPVSRLVAGFSKPQVHREVKAQLPTGKFYYENIGKIAPQSLTAQPLQCSVLLSWQTADDNPVDYFVVKRRDIAHAANDWRVIASHIVEMSYEDKTTSPVHDYEYKVLSANDCEGLSFDSTRVVTGACIQTGTVEGYLRFPDGTGIAGERINITSLDDAHSIQVQVLTDESGYFRKEGLPYYGPNKSGAYQVAPGLNGFSAVQPITFGTEPGGNLVSNVVFTVDKGVKFSGFVQYNGTSIPVQGVSFLVDGYEVHNAAGPIVSDHEGHFAFHMLQGTNHSIQAVKDGHVFYRNGYYYEDENSDEIESYWTTDKAGIYFYDDTRVKLIGRVAGGKDQGELPLDNSLSRNNLGDNLQMVLTLEGDKSSRLVWDIQNSDKKERDEVFTHNAHDKKHNYQTRVHTTINRMVVSPDPFTGEYQVMLPPVKWKIQQITAQGYATLFQDGKTGDVIDLTDSLTLHTDVLQGNWKNANGDAVNKVEVKYHAQYNRIYHSPVIIDYRQIGFENFDHFGDHYYNARNLKGDNEKVPLCYAVKKPNWPANRSDSLETRYTFGHPVFDTTHPYPVKISAIEKYYYNNDTKSEIIDIVRLKGGVVTVQNGMVSSTHRQVVPLDSVGEATYMLEAAQTPYLLTGEKALRTVTMTLEMDGTHYEAEPLRAYVLNVHVMQGAKDVLSMDKPQLIDILRDPPGGSSSAKLTKGSTLKYTYTIDWSVKGGITLDWQIGPTQSMFTGVFVGVGSGATAGFIQGANSEYSFNFGLVFSGSGKVGWSYTMTTGADISTSNAPTMVGADADVYIGTVTNFTMKPATAIRAIPESMWLTLQGEKKAGRMVEIAAGTDESGNKYHLVRDEGLTLGPKLKSTFAHSQLYLTSQLLPNLAEQCRALMFTGTEAEARDKANTTGKPVYYSLLTKDDDLFATMNVDANNNYIYNSTAPGKRNSKAKSYLIVLPDNYTDTGEDLVRNFNESMLEWMNIIRTNEQEKLTATEKVKNFDIDGGAPLSYSEDFASDYSTSSVFKHPFSGSNDSKLLADGIELLTKYFKGVFKHGGGGTKVTATEEDDSGNSSPFEFNTTWGLMSNKWSITPVAEYNVNQPYSSDRKFNRKESFTISMDRKSHLDVDVYRVKTDVDKVAHDSNGDRDVFVNVDFNNLTDEVAKKVKHEAYAGTGKVDDSDLSYARSFVYRTRGGATCRPWEGERVTQYYNPGTVLDERTKKIENPVVMLDKQSISGVPYGEPARFKIYLTNESEQPEAVYPFFGLYQVELSNPKGAKMLVDGVPLTGDARTIEVRPGIVTEKTLEVYPSEDFDYENLQIGLVSISDPATKMLAQFSVHYLQTAGNVEIASPGDKWIMNTDAPYDEARGWRMPVVISGFNKTQKNFDHIEFQYKESTRGDDYWTNLCAFYADSTIYRAASGTKAMIPENGNIITDFFGDGTVIEKAYDLRAVLFCRNGNGFLTNSSKVLSGVKDTRRPQLFGTPDPKDGILNAGDNIIFNFAENIEHNYLQATTNFEVKGETNETAVQEAPSLLFSGTGYAQSDARRNFADKNITVEVMILPDDTICDMPIFSHGSDGKQLQLWMTADKRLRAVVDDRMVETTKPINTKGFERVAMVLNKELKTLSILTDTVAATLSDVTYTGYGSLVFGSTSQPDVSKRSFFKGRMLQGRVWNRVMDLTLLNSYGNQLLTGYEMGLTDYYPMNEGSGTYATDQAQGGAHLKLEGATWAQPRAMSLRVDWDAPRDVKGLKLKERFFQRTPEQDYTLMFWFKTNAKGRGALLSNGSGRATDREAKHKFFIGFEADTLKYRSNGMEQALGTTFSDDAWHHYAMTVNRAQQVANIYVDNKLRASFSTEKLGGMVGTDFYLGNMVWYEEGADNDVMHQQNALSGNVDGIVLFEQALPTALIQRYSTKALGGSEKGLITYLDFNRQERQKNGDIALKPFVLNQKVHYDLDGKPTNERDTVFVDSPDVIMAHVDQHIGAPIQAYQELRNLNFSYVGRDNQLLVNIDELDSRVNKRTIYVTVADIPDLNGNFMASPATVAVFVDRNPLRWDKKNVVVDDCRYGQASTFSVNVVNHSGASHTYTIRALPRWLSVDVPQDVISGKGEATLRFTVSKDANVGTYDEIIYLTDENGLSEPLPISVRVYDDAPRWAVDDSMHNYSMNIVARVQIKDDIITDSKDIVGVFDVSERCMGTGRVDYDAVRAESLVFLTVYDSLAVEKSLNFKLWHNETGKVLALTPSTTIKFKPNGFEGTAKEPVVLRADDEYIQQFELAKGWNWISFNVYNNDFRNIQEILNKYDWQEGDMLTDEANNLALRFEDGRWISNMGAKLNSVMVTPASSYRIKVGRPVHFELMGFCLRQPIYRTITVKNEWNSIGYTPMMNLPIATALADYLDEATDGDVVKSRTEFAIFTEGANGTRQWKGNLRYMRPGEGYMLYRQKATTVTFEYPFFEPGSVFFESSDGTASAPAVSAYASTMTLAAAVEGVELVDGDRLVALSDGEVRGEATAIDSVFYVSISGDATAHDTALSFAIERDGDIIATTGETLAFRADALSGTPTLPTMISFVPTAQPQPGWYTLQGVKLNKRPTTTGVYIYNGRKRVVKASHSHNN